MTDTAPPTDASDELAPAREGAILRWVIRLLALAALGASAMLFNQSLDPEKSVPGCSGEHFDCSAVLATRWAYWFGLPVSAAGLLAYGGMLLASTHLHPQRDPATRRRAWLALITLAVMALGAAAWFIVLQVAAIGSICLYCLIAHLTGGAAGVVILTTAFRASHKGEDDSAVPMRGQIGTAAGVGLVALVVLVAGQLLGEPPQAHVRVVLNDFDTFHHSEAAPGEARTIGIFGGKVRLQPHQYPMLGRADAQRIFVLLYDYTCAHCRVAHGMMRQARERYGDQMALVLLPVPLSSDCNPTVKTTQPVHEHACTYARLALAVWALAPQQFEAFDQWLAQGLMPPSPQQAHERAETIIGDAATLQAELAKPWIGDALARYAGAHKESNYGSLPQVATPGLHLIGRPGDAEEWFELFERELGLKPVQATGRVAPIDYNRPHDDAQP